MFITHRFDYDMKTIKNFDPRNIFNFFYIPNIFKHSKTIFALSRSGGIRIGAFNKGKKNLSTKDKVQVS